MESFIFRSRPTREGGEAFRPFLTCPLVWGLNVHAILGACRQPLPPFAQTGGSGGKHEV